MCMKFSLITPEKVLIENKEIDDLLVPCHKGELNVLEGHTPLLTHLSTGLLKYKSKGESEYNEVVVTQGYCEIFPSKVLVLSETAETKEQLDFKRAQRAYMNMEEKLSKVTELSSKDIILYQEALKRARCRKNLSSPPHSF